MPTTLTSFKTFLLWSLFVGRINRRTRKSMQTAEKCKLQSFLQRRTHPALPKFFQPLISGGRGWDQHKSFRLSGICISDLNIFHQKYLKHYLVTWKKWKYERAAVHQYPLLLFSFWSADQDPRGRRVLTILLVFTCSKKIKKGERPSYYQGIANRRFWYCCS